MSTYNLTQQRIHFPWHAKPQGLVEFTAMINFIDDAVLLVERSKGVIWGANEAFGKLSNYDCKELPGQKADSLFAGIDAKNMVLLDGEPAILLRKLQDSIPVILLGRGIEGNQQLFLLFVKPENTEDIQQTQSVMQVLTSVSRIAEMPLEEDYSNALGLMAEMIARETGAEHVCIYQADPANPRLTKQVEIGDPVIFADVLSSTNLIRLSKPALWQAGKRLSADIHHAAKDHQMKYTGSAPLGQAGKSFGLLVASGKDEPHANIIPYLDIFASQLTRFMENYMLAENLRQEISTQGQALITSRVMMDNAQEGILILSTQMELTGMNPAAEWMLGYADWEVKGQRVENFLIGPDGLLPALEAAVKGIPTHNIGNVSLHRRSGVSFPAHIQTIPVGDEGDVSALVVLISDISENEEIRNRTQQLEQRALLGEVTAVFAHEVRNPINNIYSGLQLLSATLGEDDPNQDNLSRLQNDCVRLNHLMESVLNFSRNTQYTFEPVDLRLLLQRIIDRWRPRFSKVNVTPFFHAEEQIPLAYADPRALEQVFTNLIGNAIEAMSKNGGSLALRIAPRNVIPNRSQVVVTVSDDGPGIPDEVRERIFEPFVTTKSNGTGLGLAITKRIVTAHHGSIQCTSFPGGTMFEVTLLGYNGDET
jgi:PAS domain S-box-containing protein